jgi:hypothetical protein
LLTIEAYHSLGREQYNKKTRLGMFPSAILAIIFVPPEKVVVSMVRKICEYRVIKRLRIPQTMCNTIYRLLTVNARKILDVAQSKYCPSSPQGSMRSEPQRFIRHPPRKPSVQAMHLARNSSRTPRPTPARCCPNPSSLHHQIHWFSKSNPMELKVKSADFTPLNLYEAF